MLLRKHVYACERVYTERERERERERESEKEEQKKKSIKHP